MSIAYEHVEFGLDSVGFGVGERRGRRVNERELQRNGHAVESARVWRKVAQEHGKRLDGFRGTRNRCGSRSIGTRVPRGRRGGGRCGDAR